MKSIDERLEYEEELIALLLLIFIAHDPDWFLSPIGPSRSWFHRQVKEKGIPDVGRRVVEQTQRDMLEDIGIEADGRIRSALDGFEDRFSQGFADSLAQTHRRWVDAFERKMRSGEVLPELYPGWKAKRDSITKVTEAVSESQRRTRRAVEREHGVKLMGQWKLDPFSNWCQLCLDLADKFETQWWGIFPGYPPRHVNCRCGVHFTLLLGSAGDLVGSYPSFSRYATDLAPDRAIDPFARRLKPRSGEAFSRILTTL